MKEAKTEGMTGAVSHAVPLRGFLAGLALGLGSMTSVAHAELTMERFPAVTACEEAVSYEEQDTSMNAESARRRCRLEVLAAREAEKRAQRAAREEAARLRRVDEWTEAEAIPVRIARPLAVDGYVSGGVANYGLAVSWLLLPRLELEGWIGNRSRSSEYGPTSYFSSSPRCEGLRGKWLFFNRGNFTPFAAVGGAFCSSDVDGGTYYFDNATGNGSSEYFNGKAKAHLATVSLGLTLTTEIGLRFSLEYLHAYRVYTQASSNDMERTHNEPLRSLWAARLSEIAGAVRFQVGYAF